MHGACDTADALKSPSSGLKGSKRLGVRPLCADRIGQGDLTRASSQPSRWLLFCATVELALTTMIAPMAFLDEATSILSASADSCPNVQVVFARGTGEVPGVGLVGQACRP
jgi:hypothetical protein